MRLAVLFAVIASATLSTEALAQAGEQLLEGVRNDARRQAESSIQGALIRSFPYNGSLYGLPGQTQSASIRQSALNAALGGMLGSCKPVGMVDLSKLPGNLQMNVSGILANTAIQVPSIPASSSINALGSAAALIPQPTQVVNGQVKVGGDWMSASDYQKMRTDTQTALQQLGQQSVSGAVSPNASPAPSAVQSPAPPSTQPSVSKIWAPTNSR
jgi:hypothetical protein